jgi:transposase InsO family protein
MNRVSTASYRSSEASVPAQSVHTSATTTPRPSNAAISSVHRGERRSSWNGLTRPDPAAAPAPELVGRLFDPGAPDRAWFADISYIPTGQGWLYLATVLDGCSRRVVGWPWTTISAPS